MTDIAERIADDEAEDPPTLVGVVVEPTEAPAAPAPVRARRRPESQPILPHWLTHWPTFKATVADEARFQTKRAGFHLVRIPFWYTPKLLGHAPIGLWRVSRFVGEWVLDAPGAETRASLKGDKDKAQWFLQVSQKHGQTVFGRLLFVVAVLVGLTFGVYAYQPSTQQVAVFAAVAVIAFGIRGRRNDHPVITPFVERGAAPKVTPRLVERALGALNIPLINAEIKAAGDAGTDMVKFMGRHNSGWRVDVELPLGVTARQILKKRPELASGLRRPEMDVWPELAPEVHAGQLILWIGDENSRGRKIPWPLERSGKVDVFQPFPIGIDMRGDPVNITLMETSMIIGAQQGTGKSFNMRLLALGLALDPTAELHIHDLKGGGDYSALEPVCHAWRCGYDPDDLRYLLDDLRAICKDMNRRYKVLRELATQGIVAENKITRAVADKPEYDLGPVYLIVDEVQVGYDDDTHGAEIQALYLDIVKRGRACGINPICATQRIDSKSIPIGISSLAKLRLCGRVNSHVESELVLGTGSFSAGAHPNEFTVNDKGIAYLGGETADPVIVRFAYIDMPMAKAIVKRARAARVLHGMVTGHAAGVDLTPQDEERRESIRGDMLAVWAVDGLGKPAEKMRCEDLAERLAVAVPSVYEGWTAEQVISACRPHGMHVVQINRRVDGQQYNRPGFTWASLTAALSDREDAPDAAMDTPDSSE